MKKVFLVSLCLILTLGFVLAGCSSPPASTQPPATSAPPASTSSAPAAAPITVSFANPMPQADLMSWLGTMKPLSEALDKRTNGRIKIDPHQAGSLMTFVQMPDAMATGLGDTGFLGTSLHPALFPSWLWVGVLDPSTDTLNPLTGTYVSEILFSEFPSFSNELAAKKMQLYFFDPTVVSSLIMKKATPRMADLAGKRLRVYAGEYHAKLHEMMGAIPMSTPWSEAYDNLDKGVVDGMLTTQIGMRDNKLYEPAKFLYTLGTGIQPKMNAAYLTIYQMDSWNKLPPDIKKIMLEEAKKIEVDYSIQLRDKLLPACLEDMKKGGLTISDFPKEDVAKWGVYAGTLYDTAAKAMDAKGAPGTQIIKRYLELTKMSEADLKVLYDKVWDKRIAALK